MNKIDFVLPWVDGNDKDWLNNRKKYEPRTKNNDSLSSARFRDMETLKYVLRSIEKNCPWYNKIYLITEGHYPQWLDINHKNIVLVSHQELYLNKKHLPTFNSSSIEMNLVNLNNNLTDKFIYLNDDMIIIRPIELDRFFINELPVDFLVHGWIPRNKLFNKLKKIDSWIASINNNLKLINSILNLKILKNEYLYHKSYSYKDKISNFLMKNIYKKIFWLEHWHHPQPYLKQTLYEVYNKFCNEMMECSQNKFRNKKDLTQYIYRYWQLVNGNFYPYKHNDAIISNIDSIIVLDKLINKIESNKNINFVCFNDSVNLEDKEYYEVKERLLNYLEIIFPQKASFEV